MTLTINPMKQHSVNIGIITKLTYIYTHMSLLYPKDFYSYTQKKILILKQRNQIWTVS